MVKISKNKLFHRYFIEWVELYKAGAVRDVTLAKYQLTHRHLVELAPKLKLGQLNRQTYQKLINDFAANHERQTTMDFHHQLKSSILDAYDDGIIDRDPTRRVVIKGKEPTPKKKKFLSLVELNQLIDRLDLALDSVYDWLILIGAKTGMRFSEALGITPVDIDLAESTLSINKTWNHRSPEGGFRPTKNESSNRVISIDWKTMNQLSRFIEGIPDEKPIFDKHGRVFNSTLNNKLARYCIELNIPVISFHGLRHTHASLLLYGGVSVASVAKRLGHSNTTTTQQTYIHIIEELENQDQNKIMQFLSQI